MESLSQPDADRLIKTPKELTDVSVYTFPLPGQRLSIPLSCTSRTELFNVDINRYNIAIKKCTFNGRVHGSITLLRLDIGGPPHGNPDGAEMKCPHLHIYREGFGDKWAYPVPSESFLDLENFQATCFDFFTFINLVSPPTFKADLLNE